MLYYLITGIILDLAKGFVIPTFLVGSIRVKTPTDLSHDNSDQSGILFIKTSGITPTKFCLISALSDQIYFRTTRTFNISMNLFTLQLYELYVDYKNKFNKN